MTALSYSSLYMSIIDDLNRSVKSLFEVFKPEQPLVHKTKAPAEFKIPQPPNALATKWVSSSDTVVVRGITITGSMFYLGHELKLRDGGTEPSLVNPLMRTSSVDDLNPVRGTLCYSSFTPYQREQYLIWLSLGCKKKAPDYFLKLYVYGLEHRVLLDVPNNIIELCIVRNELFRIMAIHSSTRLYAQPLIDYLSSCILDLTDINEIANNYELYDISHIVGLYLSHDLPVPINILTEFLFGYPVISQSKTVSNILPMVKKAIRHHLEHVKANLFTTTFSYFDVSYTALSPNLKNIPFIHTMKAMDFLSSRANVVTINTLLVNIIESLQAYSKFISKNPSAQNTLEANILLPTYLYPEQFSISLANLHFEIESSHLVDMPLSNLLSLFNGDTSITKDKYNKLIQLLDIHHIGIEPATFKNGFAVDDQIVLYDNNHIDEVSDGLILAELFIELSIWAHTKEFRIEDSELFKHLQQFDLSSGRRNQLAAISRYRKLNNKSITGLKAKLKTLDLKDRITLSSLFVSMNKASGDITPAEIKMLESVFELFELDPNTLYSLLHSDIKTTTSVELDKNLIKALQKETSSVAQLLHSVFNDDTEDSDNMDISATDEVTDPGSVIDTTLSESKTKTCLNLATQASDLILYLATQAEWSRSELEKYAAEGSFMLDGILEQINEACFDLYDEPLVDEGATLIINEVIMEKILNDRNCN